MFRLLWFELYKMYNRPRSYVGFFGFLLVCFFTVLGMRYGGAEGFFSGSEFGSQMGAGEVVGSPLNAEFVAWALVGSPFAVMIITVMLPIFVCLVFGEIYAGENGDGTIRAVFASPVTRTRVFFSKLIASVLYCLTLLAFLAVTAYLMGWAAFGRGGLMALAGFEEPMLAWYSQPEAISRLLFGYALTIAPALTVGSISYFISIWLGNAIGAMGSAIMLLIVMGVVGVIPYFSEVKPYFFSSYMFLGVRAFIDPIPWPEIRQGLTVLGVYTVVCLGASLVILRRKDIHA
jgi:ABC-2 type transport system permease protein